MRLADPRTVQRARLHPGRADGGARHPRPRATAVVLAMPSRAAACRPRRSGSRRGPRRRAIGDRRVAAGRARRSVPAAMRSRAAAAANGGGGASRLGRGHRGRSGRRAGRASASIRPAWPSRSTSILRRRERQVAVEIGPDGSVHVRRDPALSVSSGFTLIEMLVALAIFSLAALALLRLGGATAANSARLQDQAMAQIGRAQPRGRDAERSGAAAVRHPDRRGGQWRPPLDAGRARPAVRPRRGSSRSRSGSPARRAAPAAPRLTIFRRAANDETRANGFTLVEMLIALSIFGMLTAAGVALLSADRADPGDVGPAARRARRDPPRPAPCSPPISPRRRRASTATATAGRSAPSPAAPATSRG